MPLYKLGRPFWDGRVYHPRGAMVVFPEGEQPRRSVEVPEPEVDIEELEEAGGLFDEDKEEEE